MKILFIQFLYILFLPLTIAAQTSPIANDTVRILFTGNSVTYHNGGMDVIFENLTSGDSTIYICTRAAPGGTSLKDRWNTYTYVKDSVENGGHDFVVIQEFSILPYWDPDRYRYWAGKWDSLARAHGAEPIHWMNHPRGADFESMDVIDSITTLIGEETGSLVAPCGLAWERVFSQYPNNTSYLYKDNVHPTYDASYLNACVIYSTITEKSSKGLVDLADSSLFLQTVADEAYFDYIDNAVLYLPFTGDYADSSGNGYTVMNNGATLAQDRFGNENSAYYFDGSATMTISADQNLPNIDSTGYTVSLWIKQDTSAYDDGYFLTYGTVAANGGYGFQYDLSNRKYRTRTNNSYTQILVGYDYGIEEYEANAIILQKWNMVTITYSNGKMKTFVNGGLYEEIEVAAFPSTAYDFVLGNSVTCWMDDIRIYNRCLSDLKVAELSESSGAVRAATLSAHTLSDFELGTLIPNKIGNSWSVILHVYNLSAPMYDPSTYMKAVENPVKTGLNSSDYVAVDVSFPTRVGGTITTTPPRKREYRIVTESGVMNEHHHIYQWKSLMADSSLFKVDSLRWWLNNQIHGTFQLYAAPCAGTGQIAYGGGIFNDHGIEIYDGDYTKAVDRMHFDFRYRAMPDSAKINHSINIGEWMAFTYDIFWTASDSGYWRLYKNGELISCRDHVQTLPDCAPDDVLEFKTGIYSRWNDWVDNEIDSLAVYFDDIELYIDPENDGISVSDICPECFNPCDTTELIIEGEYVGLEIGTIDISVSGGSQPYTFLWNTGDTTEDLFNVMAGTYTVEVIDYYGCSNSVEFAYIIPDNLLVSDSTIANTQSACFNAYNIITVAGDETNVEIQSGASANFIAEQSISILPGFHAYEGSYTNARITTIGTFCDDLPSSIVAMQSISQKNSTTTQELLKLKTELGDQLMKVFPNPNTGEFTIQLINFRDEVELSVYNSTGTQVHQLTCSNEKTIIDLSNLKRGIYFVKAMNSEKLLTQKVIIQ